MLLKKTLALSIRLCVMPLVVKTDQRRVPFDEAKLRLGMERALQKRPVGREAIEEAVSRICHKLRSLGEREVPSRTIGELVMEELHHLDEVGFVLCMIKVNGNDSY